MPKKGERKHFHYQSKKIKLPVFFPDATQAVIKTLDSTDIKNTKTPGVLVNTFHLYIDIRKNVLRNFPNGIREFMNWDGAVISDSGGFQVMSVIKRNPYKGKIIDKGVLVKQSKKKETVFTPEESIRFQMMMRTDMVVVLDDFTPPTATKRKAKETVVRTINWAKRSKKEYLRICNKLNLKKDKKPYILAVVQGGDYLDLRKKCTEKLAEIGFDGFGYGGWPINQQGEFNYEVARVIAENTPVGYFLYGLGIGKPEEIVGCVELGYQIFDCVLPTRDARHGRLYIYQAETEKAIDLNKKKFYSYFFPKKNKYLNDNTSVSRACDCLLCRNYTKAYLAHLYKINDMSALRLATIHNLRFYSLLMQKLRNKKERLVKD